MGLDLTAAELREERVRLAAERRRLDDALGDEGPGAGSCTLQDSIAQVLDEIDESLRKIEAGTYGVCARCGQPISAPRLDALPYAVRCVDCAALGTGERVR